MPTSIRTRRLLTDNFNKRAAQRLATAPSRRWQPRGSAPVMDLSLCRRTGWAAQIDSPPQECRKNRLRLVPCRGNSI